MANKTMAPAVFSAKAATKKALEIKSFMEERIAGGQLQAQRVAELRQQKAEEQKQLHKERMAKEEKTMKQMEKEKKDKETESLIGILNK